MLDGKRYLLIPRRHSRDTQPKVKHGHSILHLGMREKMNNGDMRVQGSLTKKLNRLARAVLEPESLIDPTIVRLKKKQGALRDA